MMQLQGDRAGSNRHFQSHNLTCRAATLRSQCLVRESNSVLSGKSRMHHTGMLTRPISHLLTVYNVLPSVYDYKCHNIYIQLNHVLLLVAVDDILVYDNLA